MEFNEYKYLELIKTLKSKGYESFDWGVDRIFRKKPFTDNPVFTFTYRDKPNSKVSDITHLMIK